MNRGRLLLLGGFAALIVSVFFTSGITAQPNTVQQIVPGVWFREGDIKKEGHCNKIGRAHV